RDIRVLEHVEVHLDAQAAAVAARAAGVPAQLDLLEQPRVLRLPDLRRREARRRFPVVDQAVRAVAADRGALPDRVRCAVGPRLACGFAYSPPDEGCDVAAAACGDG